MHLMCSPLESKEKAHADNCGFMACSPTCGHFPTLLLFPDNGKPGGHINSPAGLVPRNALVLTEPINSETIVREHLVAWSVAGGSCLKCPIGWGVYQKRKLCLCKPAP